MKTLILTLFSVFVLSGCVAYSDTGRWEGRVHVREGSSYPRYCDLRVSITHTDEDISFYEEGNSCWNYASKWSASTYEVRREQVWDGGNVVGWSRSDGSASMEQNRLDFSSLPYDNRRVVVSWSKDQDGISYVEESYYRGERRISSGYLRKVRVGE